MISAFGIWCPDNHSHSYSVLFCVWVNNGACLLLKQKLQLLSSKCRHTYCASCKNCLQMIPPFQLRSPLGRRPLHKDCVYLEDVSKSRKPDILKYWQGFFWFCFFVLLFFFCFLILMAFPTNYTEQPTKVTTVCKICFFFQSSLWPIGSQGFDSFTLEAKIKLFLCVRLGI